jgi:hypothetical protein
MGRVRVYTRAGTSEATADSRFVPGFAFIACCYLLAAFFVLRLEARKFGTRSHDACAAFPRFRKRLTRCL